MVFFIFILFFICYFFFKLLCYSSPLNVNTDNVVMGTDNSQVYKAGILDLVRYVLIDHITLSFFHFKMADLELPLN